MRWVLIALAAAVLALLATMAVWSSGLLKLDLDTLEERYGSSDSKFMDVDGVRLHFMDQGSGAAVVLLHASFMHLRSWDSLAEALLPDHRVIRLDFLISGLTGPEPSDDYTFDRNLQLVDQLTRRLGVDRFAIVATSSGGIVGFNYAARFPDRVNRLVLINSAGMPRTARTNPNRARGTALARWFISRHQTKEMVRTTLDRNFIEPHEPPEWLVTMNYDFGRRKGLRREGALLLRNFRTGDPESVLGQVQAPTMILWGLENQTVVHLEADVFQLWLTDAPTLKKKYPGVGHYLYLEIPEQLNGDVRAFLSGQLDDELTKLQWGPHERPPSASPQS